VPGYGIRSRSPAQLDGRTIGQAGVQAPALSDQCDDTHAVEVPWALWPRSAQRNHEVYGRNAPKSAEHVGVSFQPSCKEPRTKPRPPGRRAKQLHPPTIVPSIKPLRAIQEALVAQYEAGILAEFTP